MHVQVPVSMRKVSKARSAAAEAKEETPTKRGADKIKSEDEDDSPVSKNGESAATKAEVSESEDESFEVMGTAAALTYMSVKDDIFPGRSINHNEACFLNQNSTIFGLIKDSLISFLVYLSFKSISVFSHCWLCFFLEGLLFPKMICICRLKKF